MNITPRADEYKPVVAVMEDEYPSGDAMAKDIVKAVIARLMMRSDMYVVAVALGNGRGILYGPYLTEKQAQEAAGLVNGTGENVRIWPLTGGGILEANVHGTPMGFGYCRTKGCGHAAWLHLTAGVGRGACMEDGCECKAFKK